MQEEAAFELEIRVGAVVPRLIIGVFDGNNVIALAETWIYSCEIEASVVFSSYNFLRKLPCARPRATRTEGCRIESFS